MDPVQDYALHRFSQNTQNFVFSFIGTSRSREDAFSLAMAATISELCGSKELSDDQIIGQLSSVNEVIRIDADKIVGYLHKLNNLRKDYAGVRSWFTVVHSPETAVLDFFGISKIFSIEDLKVISECGVQITTDIVELRTLLADMGVFSEQPR